MCCNSWGRKESDMTEQLNRTNLVRTLHRIQRFAATRDPLVMCELLGVVGNG